MSRSIALVALALLVLAPSPVLAGDIKEKEPSPRAKGKLYKWTSKDGITCHYRVPKGYDHEKGANLTLILHGSNLDHRWGFANHSHKTFRTDDIVVSPDGTTSNGRGGFNSLGRPADAKRMHAFHEELKEIFNVKATYLYGHSQGSFFAFYYAGEYPEDVQGVVGHASGVWTQTQTSKKGHHQAIVLMHGTQDPVVPYMQSAGGYTSYVDRKYPVVRLRSLEWWNHWPAEHNGKVPHTSQQLAWVEGMTTSDMERLEACWDVLGKAKVPDEHDYVATYQLAKRIESLEAAPAKLKKNAAGAIKAVDALVQAHIKALEIPKDLSFEEGDWITHFAFFMRRFDGIPAADEFVAQWEKGLKKHQKDAVSHLKKYYRALHKGDKAKAFEEGIAAVKKGFLWPECHDNQFRKNVREWRDEAKSLKLAKKKLKEYDAYFAPFDEAMKDGWKSFSKINTKAGRF